MPRAERRGPRTALATDSAVTEELRDVAKTKLRNARMRANACMSLVLSRSVVLLCCGPNGSRTG